MMPPPWKNQSDTFHRKQQLLQHSLASACSVRETMLRPWKTLQRQSFVPIRMGVTGYSLGRPRRSSSLSPPPFLSGAPSLLRSSLPKRGREGEELVLATLEMPAC